MKNASACYKTKKGLTAAHVNDYAGQHYIQVYDIPYSDDDKPLYDSKMIKNARFYIEHDGSLCVHKFNEKLCFFEPVQVLPASATITEMIEYVCEAF